MSFLPSVYASPWYASVGVGVGLAVDDMSCTLSVLPRPGWALRLLVLCFHTTAWEMTFDALKSGQL